jgi:hypothetical protein
MESAQEKGLLNPVLEGTVMELAMLGYGGLRGGDRNSGQSTAFTKVKYMELKIVPCSWSWQ